MVRRISVLSEDLNKRAGHCVYSVLLALLLGKCYYKIYAKVEENEDE